MMSHKIVAQILRDEEVISSLARVGDIAIASQMGEGVLSSIPVASSLVGLYRAYRNVSDQIFTRKVVKFIQGMGGVEKTARDAFVEKMYASGEFDSFIEVVFELLDKAESQDKARVLADIIVAYVRDEIDWAVCRRLCTSVNRAHLEDLSLLKDFKRGVQLDREAAESLFSAGLLSNHGIDAGTVGDEDSEDDSGTIYDLNRYGVQLAKIL